MSIDTFKLQFEISPIILVGGVASGTPGSMRPIVSLSSGFQGDASSAGSNPDDPYDGYAHFEPIAGSTLEENEIGMFPFANQSVAANAIVVQPLKLSLLMIAPAGGDGGYTAKLSAFSSIKSTLDQHISQGGTFNVATPAYLYTFGLLISLRDITPPDSRQVQVNWQWDFIFPLLSQQSADQAQSSLVQKMTSGVQLSGDPPAYGSTTTTTGLINPGTSADLIPQVSSLPGMLAPPATGVPSTILGPGP